MIKTAIYLLVILFITQMRVKAVNYPALSPNGHRVCFEAKGNLWIAPIQGGTATRLTVNASFDAMPKWSPDGNWIAFSSTRSGHLAIYIIPSKGGEAKRLTFNTSMNYIQDWSPDGLHLLFTSNRQGSSTDLYELNVVTGREKRLFHGSDSVQNAVWSPNGKWIAIAVGEQPWWRPQYIGGKHDTIYLMQANGGTPVRVSQTSGLNDWPMFSNNGKTLYYISYQNGSSNIWSAPVDGKTLNSMGGPSPVQVTHFHDYGMRFAAIARKSPVIAYLSGFNMYSLQVGSEKPTEITVQTVSDSMDLSDPTQVFHNHLISLDLAPDDKSVVFGAYDQIWSCPVAGGDAKALTTKLTPHYDPVWSPNGKSVAYLEQDGGLGVRLMDDSSMSVQVIDTQQTTDDELVSFSPDGKYVSWVEVGGEKPGIYARDISTKRFGDAYRIADGTNIESYKWSPDSRWILYSKKDEYGSTNLWVVRCIGGVSVNITRYPGYNGMANWTADGQNIVFVSDRGGDDGVYLIPLMPSIEEKAPVYIGKGTPPPPSMIQINFEEIWNRTHPMLKTAEDILGLTLSPDARNALITVSNGEQSTFVMLDMATGHETGLATASNVTPKVCFTKDGTTFFYLTTDGSLQKIVRTQNGVQQISLSGVMHINRSDRYKMDFQEICRYIRTRFYLQGLTDNQLHDLFAVYEPQIAIAQTDEDFDMLIESLLGKLNISNSGIVSPGSLIDASNTASLGLDFDQNYTGVGIKVDGVVYHGPSDQPGAQVMKGEYLLAVDGKDVQLNESFYEALYDKANKWTNLLVSPTPDKGDARTVKMKPWPVSLTNAMRDFNADSERKSRVRDLSGGTIAYIHIRMMNANALEAFKRALFGEDQAQKGLILDLRDNPGGDLSDQFLDVLYRKPLATVMSRDSTPSEYPLQTWNRPIIALVNGNTAGDAEVFAQALQNDHLAKLVGTETAGMVAGAKNVQLMDGAVFRVPESEWRNANGQAMDGHPIIPDAIVRNPVQNTSAANDNQITTAVNMLR